MWVLMIFAAVAAVVGVAAFMRGASALDTETLGLFDRHTEGREAEQRDAA